MYLPTKWTFIYIFLSKFILLAAYNHIEGLLKVIHQSPKIKQCASKLLSQSEFNGFRSSEARDKCEGFNDPLDEKQLEPGNGYAKLINRKDSFKPPTELKHFSEFALDFPGTFTIGTRIDVHVIWPETEWEKITFTLLEGNSIGNKNHIDFSASGQTKLFKVTGLYGEGFSDTEFENDLAGTKCKLSFIAAADNVLKILLDGMALLSFQEKDITLDLLTEIRIHYVDMNEAESFLIQAVEFNEG